MTGQDRPAFVAGERVRVVIEPAEVHNVRETTLMLRVGDDVYIAVPKEPTATIRLQRLAPIEWPPELGDLWRDNNGALWFAMWTAARTGGDGRVFEGARLVMAPAQESPNLYREQRISPEELLTGYGPLQMVHREPLPEEPEPAGEDL